MDNDEYTLSGGDATLKRKEAFLKAASMKKGNISASARAAKINRRTYNRWIKDDPEFKAAFEDVMESYLDFVIDRVTSLIEGIPIKDDDGNIIDWKRLPDASTAQFVLRTLGRSRGFSERTELGVESNIQFIHDSEVVAQLIMESKKL